ncbi:prolyl aminopeptidase [Glaciihabitans sp. dw_435]|uniref:prolyl aminopeptidase n=1 Tax=Glaciihabitans sp. dw_435 TaxID=2720081 RepID=UPI001BD59E09|nr:prolyl aminopeptidase [Glaciihabitans sp. dw_435]
MLTFFPETTPHRTGMLEVGDGQKVWWAESGNPDGKPVVILHGGPGAGSLDLHRRVFDAQKYRIVQFDQRGCGKSLPRVSGPGVDLTTNTTWHLVGDIEKLRVHLGIDAWQVFGGSWGSTLALAYAETHPDRVTELVVRGVFTGRRFEFEWFSEGGIALVHPEAWERFAAPLENGTGTPGSRLVEYQELLENPDPEVYAPAARAWAVSEVMAISIEGRPALVTMLEDLTEAYPIARLEHHYFINDAWFEPGQLLKNAGVLAGIPMVIVQGRYDMLTPMLTAWDLHRALPDARLEIIENAGHSFDEPGIVDAHIRATNAFAVGA